MNEECKKYGIVSDFNLEKSSEQYIFAHIRGSREELLSVRPFPHINQVFACFKRVKPREIPLSVLFCGWCLIFFLDALK